MNPKVALICQRDYGAPSLRSAVKRAIVLSGFNLEEVQGKHVLLKPNMLGAYPPEQAITTHPSFVVAVARIFQDAGAVVTIGDSPNGVFGVDQTWATTGMRDAAESIGVAEARFEAAGSDERCGFHLSKAVLQADIVVNLPKFKTHGLTVLTLAVKNLFGCMNGIQKSHLHRKFPDVPAFAKAMVQIAEAVNPALTIMDGITAMHKNGPSGGDPYPLGMIAASTNIHALDAACCDLLSLDRRHLDTLAEAEKLGLFSLDTSIDLKGDSLESLKPKRFELPSTYTKNIRNWWITRIALRAIWSKISITPVIDRRICKRCKLCVDACPIHGIFFDPTNNNPHIKLADCIECLCCHEICPYKAIKLKKSWLLHLIQLFT